MKKIISLFRLYRIDSFFITLLSFLVTGLLVMPASFFSFSTLSLALLIPSVFVNFVYSLNSYFDAEIDAVNKPHRPIPSGAISKKLAMRYILFLAALNLVIPFLFFENRNVFYALYVFPLIGILYSNPIFPFKKKLLLAALITSLVLVMPACIAVLLAAKNEYLCFVAVVFVYCMALVPLKDIEDVKGDVAHNSGNWANIINEKRLVMASLSVLLILFAAVFLLRAQAGVLWLDAAIFSSACVEIYFLLWKKNYQTIYKSLITANLLLLVIGFFLFAVIKLVIR